MREKIDAAVKAWEREATRGLHLREFLHPKIRVPLIDRLAALFEAEAAAKPDTRATAQVDDQPKPEKPKARKAK